MTRQKKLWVDQVFGVMMDHQIEPNHFSRSFTNHIFDLSNRFRTCTCSVNFGYGSVDWDSMNFWWFSWCKWFNDYKRWTTYDVYTEAFFFLKGDGLCIEGGLRSLVLYTNLVLLSVVFGALGGTVPVTEGISVLHLTWCTEWSCTITFEEALHWEEDSPLMIYQT